MDLNLKLVEKVQMNGFQIEDLACVCSLCVYYYMYLNEHACKDRSRMQEAASDDAALVQHQAQIEQLTATCSERDREITLLGEQGQASAKKHHTPARKK